jgi:hypothetical protein
MILREVLVLALCRTIYEHPDCIGKPNDPATLAFAVTTLVVAALLAGVIPAKRAAMHRTNDRAPARMTAHELPYGWVRFIPTAVIKSRSQECSTVTKRHYFFLAALNFAHLAFAAAAILFLPAADIVRFAGAEPKVGKRKPSTRAKWRSSMSACRGVLENVLDTADIVRDGDITPIH